MDVVCIHGMTWYGCIECERDAHRAELSALKEKIVEATGASAAATGCDLIAAERQRQNTPEGWTPDHDAEHDRFELSAAAKAYITAAEAATFGSNCVTFDGFRPGETNDVWPWASSYWKPSADPIRNLVKAGALIAAEIDRLTRHSERGA